MRRRDFDDVFDRIRKEFESMFEDFGMVPGSGRMLEGGPSAPGSAPSVHNKSSRQPVTDFWETENEVIATFEMPGVDKKDIDMNVDDDSLEIKVEKKDENKDESEGSYSYSASYAGFYKRIPLPEGVDADKTKATCKNGVLEVRIPKKEEKKKSRRRVSIE